MFYTTLKLLRENNACSSGLATLIASLPEKHTETQLHSFESCSQIEWLGAWFMGSQSNH